MASRLLSLGIWRARLVVAITLIAGASEASAVTLTRGPYLQLLTTRSVTVVWNTDVPGACSLGVRRVGGATDVVSGPTSSVCAVVASGLVPGAQYGYVPRGNGIALTSETVFRADDPDRPYSFLVFGDSGTGGTKQLLLRDRMLATPADFIVHTGDMVYDAGAAADFDAEVFEPYAELLRRIVLWPSLGNHDVRTARGAPWREAFWTPANNPDDNEGYYSFDQGNAHFVVLDSNASLNPGSAQHTFLDADLATTTQLWKFVAFHHTIYSDGSHGGDVGVRDDVVPLFDRYGVDVVFMGHDHMYERTLPLRGNQVVEPGAGTVYVTTGGGGRQITGVSAGSFTAYSESAFHFTRVDVDGGRLLLQMVREDGVVRDRMELIKDGAPPPDARCGDGKVNRPDEPCDGADRFACEGACQSDCTCAPVCGDGVVNQANEQCDRNDDGSCPGLCLASCRCGQPSQFVTLAPVADTYIKAGTEAPRDHGLAKSLWSDQRPEAVAYLKFDLGSLTRPVVRATLKLYCTNASPDGGTVYPVADSAWVEGNRTGNSASTDGSGLKWADVDTSGDSEVDARDESPWVPDFSHPSDALHCVAGRADRVDVTAALGAGVGLRTLALVNDSENGAAYASRDDTDATQHPELRLELGGSRGGPESPSATVEADATVRADAPGDNFGTAEHLDADADPLELSLIRIVVGGVGGRTVESVRLVLPVANMYGAPSESGGTIRPVECGWDEQTVTWDTKPALDAQPVGTAGRVTRGTSAEFELASAIAGDGVYCFALDTANANGVIYGAREAAAGGPSVVIDVAP
jgi:Calcineurin-like phosphoesterase